MFPINKHSLDLRDDPKIVCRKLTDALRNFLKKDSNSVSILDTETISRILVSIRNLTYGFKLDKEAFISSVNSVRDTYSQYKAKPKKKNFKHDLYVTASLLLEESKYSSLVRESIDQYPTMHKAIKNEIGKAEKIQQVK